MADQSDGGWLTRKGAAALLEKLGCPLAPSTLAKKAMNQNAGKGPPFTRVGWKIVRYHKDDLIAWAKRTAVRVE